MRKEKVYPPPVWLPTVGLTRMSWTRFRQWVYKQSFPGTSKFRDYEKMETKPFGPLMLCSAVLARGPKRKSCGGIAFYLTAKGRKTFCIKNFPGRVPMSFPRNPGKAWSAHLEKSKESVCLMILPSLNSNLESI